ncbi:MAG: hypothetical protein PVS3B1_27410 [Ktedonobacteraceae bacterium]
MRFKKGMMIVDQDEQTSVTSEVKRAQRHSAFHNEVEGKEQSQHDRRFVRGMVVMKQQKNGRWCAR